MKNTTVYTVENKQIVETTFREYLNQYFNDDVNTPSGVRAQMWINEVIDHNQDEETGEWTTETRFQVMLFRLGKNNVIAEYDNIEDAEDDFYNRLESDWNNSNNNTPICFFSREDAEAELIECVNLPRSVNVHKVA